MSSKKAAEQRREKRLRLRNDATEEAPASLAALTAAQERNSNLVMLMEAQKAGMLGENEQSLLDTPDKACLSSRPDNSL
jgi:hypothetical protein